MELSCPLGIARHPRGIVRYLCAQADPVNPYNKSFIDQTISVKWRDVSSLLLLPVNGCIYPVRPQSTRKHCSVAQKLLTLNPNAKKCSCNSSSFTKVTNPPSTKVYFLENNSKIAKTVKTPHITSNYIPVTGLRLLECVYVFTL